ncbi:MAG: hypothetical protein AB8G23_10170 [Myxococcota bacterium]
MTEERDCNPPEFEEADGLSDDRLKIQIDRLRGLRSAWSALAPSCLIEQADQISETGKDLTTLIASLSGRSGSLDERDIASANHRLDAFEAQLQNLVRGVPVAQFRSTLPALIQTDRQALLDLLDTMIADPEVAGSEANLPIGPIDYLVTLLCTNAGTSEGQVRFDPVTLTSRMADLCARVQPEDELRLEATEAEFFAAANMSGAELREEMQQRTLRNQKTELGMDFFAPRILRAIVTYNASLYHRVADEIIDSGDWGLVTEAPHESSAPTPQGQSVFECDGLRDIALSARRRARGEEPLACDEDRIVWALDFDYLAPSEQKALHQTSVGTPDDPIGTAILVGLLSRSLAVLSIELQALDISPDLISDVWVRELEGCFQDSINEKISSDAYKSACALSELKNKFLLYPLTDRYQPSTPEQPEPSVGTDLPKPEDFAAPPSAVSDASPSPETAETFDRPERPRPRPPTPKALPKKESALDLVRSALEEDQSPEKQSRPKARLADIGHIKVLSLAGLVIALVLSVVLLNRNPDLESWSTAQLESVSPYLEHGHRNGKGVGTAFVGEIMPEWTELPMDVRTASGDDLVRRLREQGVKQIMIYDSDRRVRIQSVGSQVTQIN